MKQAAERLNGIVGYIAFEVRIVDTGPITEEDSMPEGSLRFAISGCWSSTGGLVDVDELHSTAAHLKQIKDEEQRVRVLAMLNKRESTLNLDPITDPATKRLAEKWGRSLSVLFSNQDDA